MHREEAERLASCHLCGASVSPEEEEAYYFGDDGVICGRCALKRGGSYDPEKSLWTRAPDVADIYDAPR